MNKIKTKITGNIYLQVGLDIKRSKAQNAEVAEMLLYKSEITHM